MWKQLGGGEPEGWDLFLPVGMTSSVPGPLHSNTGTWHLRGSSKCRLSGSSAGGREGKGNR